MKKFVLVAVVSLFSLSVYGGDGEHSHSGMSDGGGVLAEGRAYHFGVDVYTPIVTGDFALGPLGADFGAGVNFGWFEIGVFGGPTMMRAVGNSHFGWRVGVSPFLNFMDNQADVEHVAGLGVDLFYGTCHTVKTWGVTPFVGYRWYFHEQASFNIRIGYPLFRPEGGDNEFDVDPKNISVGVGVGYYL